MTGILEKLLGKRLESNKDKEVETQNRASQEEQRLGELIKSLPSDKSDKKKAIQATVFLNLVSTLYVAYKFGKDKSVWPIFEKGMKNLFN